jgi:sugar phosphate permease
VFGLACQTSLLVYLHRYTFALIKPKLAEEWELSNTELGALDSTFSLSYSLFQVPAGILADLAGVQFVLFGLILVWCLGLAMHAWAPSTAMLGLARVIMGAGQSGAFASQAKLTRSWFPASIRSWVQGWIGVFFARFGGAAANLLFATVMLGLLQLDWRTGVYVFAGIGLVHGLLFFLFYRNSPRQHYWTNEAEVELVEGDDAAKPKPRVLQMLRETRPRSLVNLLVLNAQSILSTAADNIFSNWIPLYLVAVHGLKFAEMGVFSALPLLGGALGGVAGGALNDILIKLTGNRRWTRSGIGLAGKGIASCLMFASLLLYDSPYLFCGLLFFVKLFSDTALTTTWGSCTDIGGRASASVFAFNNSVAGIGSFFAPLLYGLIADNPDWGWRWVFVAAAVIYAFCAASWLLFDCTIPVVGRREEKPKAGK